MKFVIDGGTDIDGISRQIKEHLVKEGLLEKEADGFVSDYQYISFSHIIIEVLM